MVSVIVLAGGSGKRLWPVSTREMPKQFQRLLGSQTLLQGTLDRALKLVPADRVFVVTTRAQEPLALSQAPYIPKENVIVEPVGRNTAPCLALTVASISSRLSPEDVLVILPSDHYVEQQDLFVTAVRTAIQVARQGYLVTLGVKPDRPETGYGYIETGLELFPGAHMVTRFIEKPGLEQAMALTQDPRYLWNAGIFVWSLSSFLAEMKAHMPDLYSMIERLSKLPSGSNELTETYEGLPAVSFDVAIMERTRAAAVVPVTFNWDDLGSWIGMDRVTSHHENLDKVAGDLVSIDSTDCYVWNRVGHTAIIGVKDLIIVRSGDSVLVCAKDRAQDVARLYDVAKPAMDPVSEQVKVVRKPWGREKWWAQTDFYAAKVLEISAGHSLSLQYHKKKHETVFVHSGTGLVELGEVTMEVGPGTTVDIPPGVVHRVSAVEDLVIYEVSTPHLEDVVRLDDVYGRVSRQAKSEVAAASRQEDETS